MGAHEYAPDVIVASLGEDLGYGPGERLPVGENGAAFLREKGAEKREKSEIVPVHVASGALEKMKKPGRSPCRAPG